MSGRRCVITGLGVLTPNANRVDSFWKNCLNGISGVGRITHFDPSNVASQIAGEVFEFNPEDHFDKRVVRRNDNVQLYALYTADQAIKDSGIDFDSVNGDRFGCIIGSGIGGLETLEKQHTVKLEKGPSKISPFFIPMMISDMCAGAVALKYGLRGPNYATVSACASSTHAIADAFRMIRWGDADMMVSGGSEASITELAVGGFCSARALSTRNDEPERASRPFDRDRDGFIIAEGSGMVVLEEYEHAKKRGANIYGEILGCGYSCDAYHITAPAPNGEGAARAISSAMRDGSVSPDEIDYINSHGTSTDLGDVAEAQAIKSVFGERATKIAINSTKSMLGHLLGAAGAAEVAIVALSLKNQVVHPTINLENPEDGCDLDFVTEGAREIKIDYALSNSFGFGGHNVSILFKSV